MKMDHPDSILIVKLSAIGDVVHSLPLLEVLKENFPMTRIDWLVEEDASQILEGHPAIDRMIVSRRKTWQKNAVKVSEYGAVVKEAIRFLREIRAEKYDLVIDLQGLLKSGLLTGLSRGRRKIGIAGSREGGWLFLRERPVPVDYEQHAIDRYLKLAQYLKCRVISWNGHIPISESDKRAINQQLNTDGPLKKPLVAINPMAKWDTKLWEPERFAVLADRVRDNLSCEIIFTGSRDDRAIIDGISDMMKKRPLNFAGRTSLKELAYLYKKCNAFVTTDTGPMHIAAAMGCRVVALFGPTAPWRTGPYGQGHKVIRTGIECSPCFKKRCDSMVCMKEITVESVFQAVEEIILTEESLKGSE